MNTNILQKVIDELNKDNPRLDYVKGILETLVEAVPEITSTPINNTTVIPGLRTSETPKVDFVPSPRLGNVDLSAIQTEN